MFSAKVKIHKKLFPMSMKKNNLVVWKPRNRLGKKIKIWPRNIFKNIVEEKIKRENRHLVRKSAGEISHPKKKLHGENIFRYRRKIVRCYI